MLREAGVVDAGGYGLTVMFAGVVAALRGTPPPPLEHHAPARVTHPQHHSSSYRYCTNFAVTGDELEPAPWIARSSRSATPCSSWATPHAQGPRPHRRPELATGLFDGSAAVSRLDVADMRLQMAARASASATAAAGGEVRRARRRLG